ncbi:MAG TPA: hypothetical protein PKU78_02420 [Candidatus Dojkabacteria bacterium]|nr:hypothetical protein [Candidatus Dojkabacteria bacterium]HRO65051.1 hypothetical protein [Candidatus Dojkabacteria bacterium]HRP37486.1 hypothetical protein [Candidatus Dojkabacteria bacterium]HRP50956.1 hypothetical protein [Candidatus Dojkabacteria bacterium]
MGIKDYSYNILQYRVKQIIKRLLKGMDEPFLCIITPVFDPCLKSLKGLIADLQYQTYENFIHVSIANGKEPKIHNLIEHVRINDKRFVYDEIPFDNSYKDSGLVENLLIINGKRRNFVMSKYDALMYLNIGADFKLTDNQIFEKLHNTHMETRKDIIILESEVAEKKYPLYPINKHRHIDLTNFCYSKKLARTIPYPEDIDPEFDVANDFRYFDKIANFKVLEGIYGQKDGRNFYKTIEDIYNEQHTKK